MATNSILQLNNVSKQFRQGESVVAALQSVSLSVEQGEFVAVMGASGSGKSTLLHVAAGLTRPDAGSVRIEDRDIATLSDRQLTQLRRQRIGLVFQAFNLIPALSAEENITLPILADGRTDSIEARLDELLVRLGIQERRHHRPDAMSGGEQQRAAIARALITDPALLLADEPTGSLDSVSGQNLCRLLSELGREQSRTIVVVTHEPAVAIWAQRVVIMKDGSVLTEFTTQGIGGAQALAAHYQEVLNTNTHAAPATAL